MIFHDFSTYLKKVVCFFKTFFGKVEKNSSKWIKISENSWNKRIMKTEVYEKKNIINFHKKKLQLQKKNLDKKISNIFFYEMDQKNSEKD